MKFNWNIGFEWVVTGAAVLGVIALLASGAQAPDVGVSPGVTSATSNDR